MCPRVGQRALVPADVVSAEHVADDDGETGEDADVRRGVAQPDLEAAVEANRGPTV